MKKKTDRELLDKELKALNGRLRALAKRYPFHTVTEFMDWVDKEISDRRKEVKAKTKGSKK